MDDLGLDWDKHLKFETTIRIRFYKRGGLDCYHCNEPFGPYRKSFNGVCGDCIGAGKEAPKELSFRAVITKGTFEKLP